jgi:hypothetical protein
MLRSAAILAALCAMAAEAGAAKLYLLAGTPSYDLPVNLYRLVPESPGTAELVTEVSKGLDAVLVDYDQRILVVASPIDKPTKFAALEMSAPEKMKVAQTPEMPSDTTPVRLFLADIPARGIGVVQALAKVAGSSVTYNPALTFIPMRGASNLITSISGDTLKYAKFSGLVGGGVRMPVSDTEVRGDPLRDVIAMKIGAGISISRPPYVRQRDDTYRLIANSDARTILQPTDTADPGVIDILNKSSHEWRRVPLPFDSTRIRVFGHWLGGIEQILASSRPGRHVENAVIIDRTDTFDESPGSPKRKSEVMATPYRNNPAMNVDDVFWTDHVSGIIYPGELLLMNLDTGVQLRISTGAGDSEIVFADDNTAFYRVDDALFRRDIHGGSLGDAVKLAEGPEIVQVHWAWLN